MEKLLREKIKKIKSVVFDGDGVFFSGRVFVDPQKGEALKERSHVDGQGISLLRAAGLRIVLMSGEKTGFLESIGRKLNSLPSVKSGKWPKIDVFTDFQGKRKVEAVQAWLDRLQLSWEDCAAMGDDLADYSLLQKVGLAAAPAQAEEIIKKIVQYVAPREGGNGAIRDFCNLILEGKDIDLTSLDLQ